MIIAIPSEFPGGLDAQIAPHFGHCAMFTLVEIEGGEIKKVGLLPNQGHEQGGCMAPVMMLKQAGAHALISGGMGMRPLAGFQQVGIQVFFSEEEPLVSSAVQRVIDGTAREFGPAQTCGGGGDHGGGGCGGH